MAIGCVKLDRYLAVELYDACLAHLPRSISVFNLRYFPLTGELGSALKFSSFAGSFGSAAAQKEKKKSDQR